MVNKNEKAKNLKGYPCNQVEHSNIKLRDQKRFNMRYTHCKARALTKIHSPGYTILLTFSFSSTITTL